MSGGRVERQEAEDGGSVQSGEETKRRVRAKQHRKVQPMTRAGQVDRTPRKVTYTILAKKTSNNQIGCVSLCVCGEVGQKIRGRGKGEKSVIGCTSPWSKEYI